MADKFCPILSAGSGGAARACMGNSCMLYFESSVGMACGLVKEPQQINSKVDILSAQMQEVQVALNVLVDKGVGSK